jgi:NitT/TauT family transport system permease protein
MIRQDISRGWYVVLGVASLVTLALLYTLLAEAVHRDQPDNKTIPTWSQLWHEGVKPAFVPRVETLPRAGDWDPVAKKIVYHTETIVHPPLVWEDGKATLGRLVWALLLASGLSIFLGLLMGCYQYAEAFFLPPLSFLAKIAPTAMIAVFLVLGNMGVPYYTATIMFGLVPTMTQSIFHAAKYDVPEELLFKARTLGATQIECIWDVIFKYILPKVLETVRLQIGPAIIYLIAAEWALGEVGFGCRMRLLQKSLDMSVIYTYLITLGVFGLVTDRVLIWTQGRVCPWFGR